MSIWFNIRNISVIKLYDLQEIINKMYLQDIYTAAENENWGAIWKQNRLFYLWCLAGKIYKPPLNCKIPFKYIQGVIRCNKSKMH